jgi:hypothetical protein
VEQLEGQVAELTGTLQSMQGMMQHMMEAIGASKPQHVAPPEPQPVDITTEDWGEEHDTYYVRLKPYNKRRGHLRLRMLVREIGRPINGGTGEVGQVPEWIRLPRDKAAGCKKYHQDDQNPDSPLCFDIATEAQMVEINRQEDQQRMASLGMAGLSPVEILEQADKMRARAHVKTPNNKLSTVDGAQRFANAQPGRQAALQGLAEPATIEPAARAQPRPSSKEPAIVEDMAQVAGKAKLEGDMQRVAELTGGAVHGRVSPT